ncbi:MAG: hypothetical protein AAGG44_09255, partial [Planctomycetota bacterium]
MRTPHTPAAATGKLDARDRSGDDLGSGFLAPSPLHDTGCPVHVRDMMGKIALHWQILIGMIAGLIFGVVAVNMELGWLVTDWIKPFGTIFINML